MAISNEMIDQLLNNVTTEEDLFGKDGILKQLSARLIGRMLDTEITDTLGYKKHSKKPEMQPNYRNGSTPKTVTTGNGKIQINVPRDRDGKFEPEIVKKHQRRLSGLNAQVLSLYGKGMTVRDIQSFLEELYGTEVSRDLISNITDAILEEVNLWRNRPLDEVYPIIYIDGFVVKGRFEGRVANRTVYVVYGITFEGLKDVIGLYIDGSEGAKYWLSVLNELKNRGLKDILILCADGLKGLPQAVEAIYPKTIFQTCVVHQVRYSLNFVPYQERKAVAASLKKIYQAATVGEAEAALDDFEIEWGDKYKAIVNSWRNNWSKIIPFFDYPQDIRRIIYTTNIVESLNRTLRKAVKTRGSFPTEDAIYKVLFLAISGVSKKWTMPIRNWKQALNQFAIMFEGRIPNKYLTA